MMETAVNGDGQSPASDTRSREDLLSEVSRLERQVGELTLAGHQFVSTQMQSLLHNSSDAIIQFNPDGTIATFNTTAERIFGHSEIELMYQPADDLFVCPEEFIENIPAWLAHYSSTVENQYDQPLLNEYESLVEKHGLKMQFDSPDFDTHGCFDPERVVIGLLELLLNAVEHGNLGITYDEKSELKENETWEEEVNRRLADTANQDKFVDVSFKREAGGVRIIIKDQGEGSDWERYLEMDPSLIFDSHGRGIAMSRMVSFDSTEYRGCGNKVEVYAASTPPSLS